MKIPPYLKPGDTIGIVAPAGFMPIEKMQACIETLDNWGFNVEMGATTHSESQNYFSGSDEERLQDLQAMLDNKKIKAILCARGGYGTSRIIDKLNFKKFKKNPKWIVGFSDITVLHSHLNVEYRIASLHSPMAAAFNDGGSNNPYIQSLYKAMTGEKAHYESEASPYNRTGTIKAELVGGNLALLTHLVGTSSDIKTKHKLLFIEDVGEYTYNVDRMLIQLKRAGKLHKLAGLIVGSFSENKDTERPFGKDVYDIIQEHVKEFDYPVCFGFPVGHVKENYALKIGARYQFSVEESGVILSEI